MSDTTPLPIVCGCVKQVIPSLGSGPEWAPDSDCSMCGGSGWRAKEPAQPAPDARGTRDETAAIATWACDQCGISLSILQHRLPEWTWEAIKIGDKCPMRYVQSSNCNGVVRAGSAPVIKNGRSPGSAEQAEEIKDLKEETVVWCKQYEGLGERHEQTLTEITRLVAQVDTLLKTDVQSMALLCRRDKEIEDLKANRRKLFARIEREGVILREGQQEIEEFRQSFDLYCTATKSLSVAWWVAHPEQRDIIPDTSEMCRWTAERLEELEGALVSALAESRIQAEAIERCRQLYMKVGEDAGRLLDTRTSERDRARATGVRLEGEVARLQAQSTAFFEHGSAQGARVRELTEAVRRGESLVADARGWLDGSKRNQEMAMLSGQVDIEVRSLLDEASSVLAAALSPAQETASIEHPVGSKRANETGGEETGEQPT